MVTTATALAAYLLITVSGVGEVRTSPQPDMHACAEARNVALYAATVEDDAAAADKAAAVPEARRRAWEDAHLFRPPADDAERWYVKEWDAGHLFATSAYEFRKPGLLRDLDQSGSVGPSYSPRDGEWADLHNGGWVKHQGHKTRTAVCTPAEGTVGAP